MPAYRTAIGLLVPAAVVLGASIAWGTVWAILAALAGLIWLAWWFDDRAGTFLPLACMFVLILGVLAGLLALIVIVHSA